MKNMKPTPLPTNKRFDEIFQTYQEPFNKLRADRIRTNAAENVWLRRFDLGLNKDENNTDTANSRATT
jgi:hypothetical protein